MHETNIQSAVLLPIPRLARYLVFTLRSDAAPATSLEVLHALDVDKRCVVGIGQPLSEHLDRSLPGLRAFPALPASGVEIPSTQQALWCWLCGDDHGELVHRTRAFATALEKTFHLQQVTDAFKFGNDDLGRDLTGYEDGTENPTGADATNAAIVNDLGPSMNGSSFVAVQQWVHDLNVFSAMPQPEQDHIMGRRISDNEEIEDAPESAHVKRTEQESYEPAAFMLRRSMPWAAGKAAGLMFVAFGKSLDPFEAQLKRMAGLDDGIIDALFRFSCPVSGSYYWCPPVKDGHLNLDACTG